MSSSQRPISLEEEASALWVRRAHGEWTPEDQQVFERRLAGDPAFAETYHLAEQSAAALRACADSPEMMRFRERAFADARRSGARRWLGPDAGRARRWLRAAGVAAGLAVLAAAWQFSPWGYRPGHYQTNIGEQRILELADHSRVVLDASTRVSVRYTDESRTIELLEGQAQFSVEKDPARPFRVRAGGHTIVALGTVFTVELTDRNVRVAMIDGRVAVSSSAPGAPDAMELAAGEAFSAGADGGPAVVGRADLEAATAWRNGKVVFRAERLADAVQRMNRYSRIQLTIADPALADETVNGVFELGDTQGFIAAVQVALPVVAEYPDPNTVRFSPRR